MAEFSYEAKDRQGKSVQGLIEAPNEDQAINSLQQKGLIILRFGYSEKQLFERDLATTFVRPSKKDVVIFTRQLATLIEADVPLVDGLHILAAQTEKEVFRKVINALAFSIEGGSTLSLAFSEHPKTFSDFYISLIRAGEVSGKLQVTLLYLADYLERSAALTSKIKGALAYPIFVLGAMIIVVTILVTTVLPQLLSIIKDAGVTDLPLTTRILLFITEFINNNLVVIVIALVALIVSVFYYLRTPRGREQLDDLLIKAPQFGRVARNLYIARMAETLSTLIKAGVPILESLTIASDVVGNRSYKNILLEARSNVQGGGTISDVMAKYKEVPSLVSSMIAIGEKTGRTDFMLENLFRFYKAEAENDIQNLSQLIEPIMILLLGIGVGVIVSAVLLPIYSLVGAG